VDEAAQATEPSLAPALHLVVSDQFNVQIILSGDPQQLGPNLISEQAVKSGLSTPLMERLILHSYYRGPNAPMFNLCRNYRSHPSLLMMPSALFYSKDLIPCSMDINEGDFNYFPRIPSYSYTGIPHLKEVPIIESNWPFLFYPVRGTEKHGHLENILTAGWYNPEEATVILNLVETMIKHSKKPIKNDIGIMTVSRRQVVHLRNIFRAANLSEINIGTVEDYQGMERKYVFLSIVRVSEELVDQDVKNNSGLVNQLKRLNVAISRAQNLLIVVGSPKHLWIDNLWKQIFFFCDRNGLWMKNADEGDKIELLDINNWTVKRNLFHSSAIGSRPAFGSHDIVVSELEQTYRAQTRHLGARGGYDEKYGNSTN
jgi:superfamily I DNA and/or RNA helicase